MDALIDAMRSNAKEQSDLIRAPPGMSASFEMKMRFVTREFAFDMSEHRDMAKDCALLPKPYAPTLQEALAPAVRDATPAQRSLSHSQAIASSTATTATKRSQGSAAVTTAVRSSSDSRRRSSLDENRTTDSTSALTVASRSTRSRGGAHSASALAAVSSDLSLADHTLAQLQREDIGPAPTAALDVHSDTQLRAGRFSGTLHSASGALQSLAHTVHALSQQMASGERSEGLVEQLQQTAGALQSISRAVQAANTEAVRVVDSSTRECLDVTLNANMLADLLLQAQMKHQQRH